MADIKIQLYKKTGSDFESVLLQNADWYGIPNKPTTFTPTNHEHPISEVTNLQETINLLETGGGAEITGADEIDVIAQANINKGDTVRVTAGTTGIYVETTPTTLPASTGRGCAFNHDGTRLAVAHEGSPYITIYDTCATTTYTKLSNPTTLPAGNAWGCAFNHNGTRLAVGHIDPPYITAYGVVYGTPLAYKANNLLSGLAGRYGYAKENISLSAIGKVDVLFEA